MSKCKTCGLKIATAVELRVLSKISLREQKHLRAARCMCRDFVHGHSPETQCSSPEEPLNLDYYDRRMR